jgi:hydroxyethylthiazole kinase
LGALPVMAHAGEEVEEMARLASSLVLNIGTLSGHWVEAMLLAGSAATARQIPVVLDPVGAGATEYRTATAHRILRVVDVTVLRGNAGEIATLVGAQAEVRGVESIDVGMEPAELARAAARSLGVVASVTGPVDYVSDGERVLAVSNGDACLRRSPVRACRVAPVASCAAGEPLDAAAEALAAFVSPEDAARAARRAGSFHTPLRQALRTRSRRACGSRSCEGR